MRKKQILMITLSLLLLLQPFLRSDISTAEIDQSEIVSPIEVSWDKTIKQAIGVGGEEQIMTNFNPNPGFEYNDTDEGPGDTYYYGSAYQFTNEVYTGWTHSGSYAAHLSSYGNIQNYASAYLYRGVDSAPQPYLVENIEMDFWYYLISNPDLATDGSIYLRLNFNTPAGGRSIYYYLSDSSVPTNTSSTRTNYDLTGSSPFSVWNNFHRDITVDFAARFGGPVPLAYMSYMYFFCESPDDATGLAQYVVDDVSVTNSSAYNWLSVNGDFETGDGLHWSGYNRGTGTVFLTDDHVGGSKAVNMTSYSDVDGVNTETNLYSDVGNWGDPPLGIYANQPGDVVVSFDWKYNDYNAISSNQAYFYIYGYNGSFDINIYWFLGDESDIMTSSNSTGPSSAYIYVTAPGFGIRDVWTGFSFDVYDVFSEQNITNMPITDVGFRVYSGSNIGARTELLLDNYEVIADPLGDPGFEEDWYVTYNNPIPSWEGNTNENYLSLSPISHSGDNAANISSHSSAGQVRLYRDTFINVGDNLFSDIWWGVDALDSTSNSYAQIYFELDHENYLNYLFAAGDTFSTTNNSNSYYFYADHFNEMYQWNLFERNLAEDAINSFGNENWNITEVRLIVYGSGVEMNSLFVDDVHFVRDTMGPQLVSEGLINTPTYYDDAVLEILAYDYFSTVSYVEVFYRQNSGWNSAVATMFGSAFRVTIPAHDWGIPVEYYIVMRDSLGHVTTDNNGGGYYFYDVVDNVDPLVTILTVTTDEDYGLAEISLFCEDVGSGIEFVEIYDGGVDPVAILTGDPFNYAWDPEVIQESGLHDIRVVAYDYAGNSAEATFDISVGVYQPPGPFVSFFQSWGTLMGAAIVGTAWGVVAIVQYVKKPKT